MTSKEHNQDKKAAHSTMTNYIPEILTGYEHFIGRTQELQQIDYWLTKDNLVIITGCAGIGKSSLVVEYAKLNKQNKIIHFFVATSKNRLDQQYRELAQELNINVNQQPNNLIMQLVNNKLSTITNKPILFIFDNIDQYDDIKDYFVNLPVNIQVIMNTRQPMLIANKPHLVLDELNIINAEQYLKSSLAHRNFSNAIIHDIIENTGTLPYDIKCITAYLLDNPDIDSSTDFKKIGNNIKDQLFQEFALSTDPTTLHAWKILQYASNLDPDFISIDLIKELFPQDFKLSAAALKKLESLSLISIINNQNSQAGFRIHRKLQKNIQNSMQHHPEHSINNQKLINNLLGVLDQLFPKLTFNKNKDLRTSIALQPHIELLLNSKINVASEINKNHQANLYYNLAEYYLRVNVNYDKSLEYAKISLNYRCNIYKHNHSYLANSYNIVGIIYRRIGNVQEGLKYLNKALQIRQQLYSGNHPELADSYYTIGFAYNQHGETEKGLEYSEIALKLNKQLYPNNHYEVGCSLNALGIGYIDLGNFEKSLEYLKAGLKVFYALNPINYEKIAILQNNLAYNYNKLGNYKKALRHSNISVELLKKMYPDGHPRIISSMDDLGYSLIKTNHVRQGLNVLHQALLLSKKFNMNKHCITAFVLHSLGQGYLKNKNYKEAFKYGEEALHLRKELYAEVKNHHELAESLCSLGDINLALGNKTKSLELYKKALAMYTALSLLHLPETAEIKQKINKLT